MIIDKIAIFIGYFWINVFVVGTVQAAIFNKVLDSLTIDQKIITGIICLLMTIGCVNRELIIEKFPIDIDYKRIKEIYDKITNIDLSDFSLGKLMREKGKFTDVTYNLFEKPISHKFDAIASVNEKYNDPLINFEYIINIHNKYNQLFPHLKHEEVSILIYNFNSSLQIKCFFIDFLQNFILFLF